MSRSLLTLATPADTEHLGQTLAQHLPQGCIVMYLDGDLGAGKTTTARAVLHALGVTGAVRSPTYTLIERYDTPHGEVAHLDLYRIADPEELEYLALDELAGRARLWLIEWPQRGQGALPAPDLILRLGVDGNGRRAELEVVSPRGQEWASAVLQAMCFLLPPGSKSRLATEGARLRRQDAEANGEAGPKGVPQERHVRADEGTAGA